MERKLTSAGIIAVTLIAIVSIPFIPKELIGKFGFFIFLVPMGIIILAVIAAFMLVNKKSALDDLQNNRQKVLAELKEAEKHYLQRRIDKATFDSISKEKNAELISVEAEIDSSKKNALTKDDFKKADSLSSDKRKVLFELLEEKQKKIHELKLTENSFYKRKIDEGMYKKICTDINKEIISLESQIKSLQETEEISKIKKQLKESAQEIAKQKKATIERAKLDYFEELEEDIFDQAKEPN
jgi:hypothetical protein